MNYRSRSNGLNKRHRAEIRAICASEFGGIASRSFSASSTWAHRSDCQAQPLKNENQFSIREKRQHLDGGSFLLYRHWDGAGEYIETDFRPLYKHDPFERLERSHSRVGSRY